MRPVGQSIRHEPRLPPLLAPCNSGSRNPAAAE
jgi:hypothetical protein